MKKITGKAERKMLDKRHLAMGRDLGGGGQRTGKRLRKAETASAPEESTKATSEQMKEGVETLYCFCWLPLAAKREECGNQPERNL